MTSLFRRKTVKTAEPSSSAEGPPSIKDLLEKALKSVPRCDPALDAMPVEIQENILRLSELTRLDKLSLRAACVKTGAFSFIEPFQRNEVFNLEKEPCLETPQWPGNPLSCCVCRRLRPKNKFTDKTVRSKLRSRGGLQAALRVCIDCGVNPDSTGQVMYCRGTYLTISRQAHVVCSTCGKVGRIGTKKGKQCKECWNQETQAQQAENLEARKRARDQAPDVKPSSFGVHKGKIIDKKILDSMPASVKTKARKRGKKLQQFLHEVSDKHTPPSKAFSASMKIADPPTSSSHNQATSTEMDVD